MYKYIKVRIIMYDGQTIDHDLPPGDHGDQVLADMLRDQYPRGYLIKKIKASSPTKDDFMWWLDD